MPDFDITDPTSGRTITVTGSAAPTQEDAAYIFGHPAAQPEGSTLGAYASDVARVPGAVASIPRTLLYDLPNYLSGQGGKEPTDPLARVENAVLPSAQGVNDALGLTPHLVDHTSVPGKLTGAALIGALSGGLLNPRNFFNMLQAGRGALATLGDTAKVGAASAAAEGAGMIDPGNLPLQLGAAALAHGASSAAGTVARAGGGVLADTGRQVFAPTRAGEREAARTLGRVDPTTPAVALAQPSGEALAHSADATRSATDAIGPGLPDWQAGAQLRANLAERAGALKATRSDAAGQGYDAFREQPALPAEKLEDFMSRPSFRKAISAASDAVLDEGSEPLTNYWDFDEHTGPVLRAKSAIPPDTLDRVKRQLDDAASNANAGSAAERTAKILRDQFVGFLDKQYPATDGFPGYAAIRDDFANASRPLDPMQHGPVAKVLDTQKQFGQTRHTFPEERIPDLFLRSPATRTDLNQLVDAFGGDRGAALGALEQHLAGVSQRAIRPDGTLDTAAFDKAMAPYQKSLGGVGMWFPTLGQKFNTAKAAQATLDNMRTQRSLADAVGTGALRDSGGAITGESLGNWLKTNRDALAASQSPGAVMRLQAIANALRGPQGELADALKSEFAPAALGVALGGTEGGLVGAMMHKATKGAFSGLDAKRQAAFNAAIERAVLDPDHAAKLTAEMAKRPRYLSPTRALVQAVGAMIPATTAAQKSP